MTKQDTKYWKCKWFGHKWEVVYIKKDERWKFIGAYCGRWQCYFGHDELVDFIKKHQPIINSDYVEYFYPPTMKITQIND